MLKLMIDPPIVQSAMAGIADKNFCQEMLDYGVGMCTFGAYPLDRINNQASISVIKRGRKEFVVELNNINPDIWAKRHFTLTKKYQHQLITLNIRLVRVDDLSKSLLSSITPYIDMVELNAHCRQKEILNIGGGQNLTLEPKKLLKLIKEIRQVVNVKIGIKIRGLNSHKISENIELFEREKVNYFHIDCMIPGKDKANIQYIKDISSITNIPVIGNNSVRSVATINKMLDAGAIAASLARPLLHNRKFMAELINEWRKEK
ncbi:MAG: tRNA-dihydrouridine synthase [Candidatus Heimdallarchaeaceae archaeon]